MTEDRTRSFAVKVVVVGLCLITLGLFAIAGGLLYAHGPDAVPGELWGAAGTALGYLGGMLTSTSQRSSGDTGSTTITNAEQVTVPQPAPPAPVTVQSAEQPIEDPAPEQTPSPTDLDGPAGLEPVDESGAGEARLIGCVAVGLVAGILLLELLRAAF